MFSTAENQLHAKFIYHKLSTKLHITVDLTPSLLRCEPSVKHETGYVYHALQDAMLKVCGRH